MKTLTTALEQTLKQRFTTESVDTAITLINGKESVHDIQLFNEPLLIALCQKAAVVSQSRLSFFYEAALDESARAQCLRLITSILDHDSTMVNQSHARRTPLSIAAQGENTALCRLLIQRGAELTFFFHYLSSWSKDHWSEALALFTETLTARPETAVLLNKEYMINGDKTPHYVLDYAIVYRNIELFKLLKKFNAKPNTHDPLHMWNFAYETNNSDLLEELLINNIAHYQNEQGATALHLISDKIWAKKLLKAGANINASSEHFPTPITQHINMLLFTENNTALYDQYYELIEYLLMHGANIELLDNKGRDVFSSIFEKFDNKIARLLLRFINITTPQWSTLLHRAVQAQQWQFARILIDKNIALDIKDHENKQAIERLPDSAYHLLTNDEINQDVKFITEYLIKNTTQALDMHNAQKLLMYCIVLDLYDKFLIILNRYFTSPNLLDYELWGGTPLTATLSNDKAKYFDVLIKHKVNVNYQLTTSKSTAIHLAVQKLLPEFVQELLSAGANVMLENNLYVWPMVTLCQYFDHSAPAKIIFKALYAKQNLQAKNSQGRDLLQILLDYASNHFFVCRILEASQILPDLEAQIKLLKYIVENNLQELASRFLTENSVENNKKLLPLFARHTIQAQHNDFLILLFKHHLPANIVLTNNYGTLPPFLLESIFLHPQARQGMDTANLQKMAITVIEQGAYIHIETPENISFLHAAITYCWHSVIEKLLPYYQKQLNCTYTHHDRKTSFLKTAIMADDKTIVKLLIDAGANKEVLDDSKRNSIHLACVRNNLELTRYLHEEHQVAINTTYPDINFMTTIEKSALDIVLEKHDFTKSLLLIDYLLSHGCPVFSHTVNIAVTRNLPEVFIIRLLSALPNEALDGLAFLHHVLQYELNDVVIWLLESKHATQQLKNFDRNGHSALHIAAQKGLANLYRKMLAHGADPMITDPFGERPYHHAWYLGKNIIMGWTQFSGDLCSDDFKIICDTLKQEKEFEHEKPEQCILLTSIYARRLLTLLNTSANVLTYIREHRTPNIFSPIHDLCLFTVPKTSAYDRSHWAELALKDGPKLAAYFHLADKIEALLGRKPDNLMEVKKSAKRIHYMREEEKPSLAYLFSEYLIPEEAFDLTLNCLARIPVKDQLPNITIYGDALPESLHEFYLKKLPKTDPRGFILGAMTHNCQSVGSAGQDCALHGMLSEYGGFYVLFKKTAPSEIEKKERLIQSIVSVADYDSFLKKINTSEQRKKYLETKRVLADKYRISINDNKALYTALLDEEKMHLERLKEGEVIAQCWAWFATDGSLVFDSWERKRDEYDVLCQPFLCAAAKQIVAQGVPRVLIGLGGYTPEQAFPQKLNILTEPRDYKGYRDSSEKQATIWDSVNQANTPPSQSDNTNFALSIVDELIKYSLFFAPHQDIYQANNVDNLLQYYAKDNPDVIILPSYMPNNKNPYQPVTKEKIKEILDPAALNKEREVIILIQALRLQQYWQGIIMLFDMKKYQPNKLSAALQIFYLHPAAKKIDTVSLNEINPFIHKHWSSNDARIDNKLCYTSAPYHSGAWLMATLKVFIQQKLLRPIYYAETDFQDLTTQHQNELQIALMSDLQFKP
ncbi:MAG: ankyrin repeat domain-containing protein [Legionellales bacterium]|jgi:ankyrin repeat protein